MPIIIYLYNSKENVCTLRVPNGLHNLELLQSPKFPRDLIKISHKLRIHHINFHTKNK
jgi:hypothetical protein